MIRDMGLSQKTVIQILSTFKEPMTDIKAFRVVIRDKNDRNSFVLQLRQCELIRASQLDIHCIIQLRF